MGKQNDVETSLAVRVMSQISQRLSDNAMPLCEQDVPVLAMLSSTLRSELLFETRIPFLFCHPLLRIWSAVDPSSLRTLCDEAIRFLSFAPQDCIFDPSLLAEYCFLV